MKWSPLVEVADVAFLKLVVSGQTEHEEHRPWLHLPSSAGLETRGKKCAGQPSCHQQT
jgi:hypothetical protein